MPFSDIKVPVQILLLYYDSSGGHRLVLKFFQVFVKNFALDYYLLLPIRHCFLKLSWKLMIVFMGQTPGGSTKFQI